MIVNNNVEQFHAKDIIEFEKNGVQLEGEIIKITSFGFAQVNAYGQILNASLATAKMVREYLHDEDEIFV